MIEEVDFSIPTNRIATDYWFEEEDNTWVLKASKKHIKEDGYIHKYIGYNDQAKLSNLYRAFLGILKPFYSLTPPIDQEHWLEVLDKESPKYSEEVATVVMGRIVDHAKEFGLGWFKPTKSKVLNDAGITGGVKVPYFAYQIKQDEACEGNIYPNEPTLRNIVEHALIMYEGLEWNYDEWIQDDLFTTYFNQLGQPKMTATPEGLIIKCEGYWECVWLSFSMDSKRVHATKCLYCSAPVIKNKRAKFCNDLCRSRYNNERYRQEKKEQRDIKALAKNLENIKQKLSEVENQVSDEAKSKAELQEAVTYLEKAIKVAMKEKK